ncbi:hypothetical protein TRFO_05135 [Tritrichomonas foetus]|uniref:Mitochondrial carrier protein n=1 Tax=Tritrichomonas foetus TaxID=1144522 RepID=A0A1J4K7Z6_9EUKA|nr:hypothetical protein TRFO_05135 [Tritrichomonas foetus]|eukprot:OHT07519.1 hypothetical protein TRFO_05135 [Tritrichomonas foetus]
MNTKIADEILLSTSPPEQSPFSRSSAFLTGFAVGGLAQTLSTPIGNIIKLIPYSPLSLSAAIQDQYIEEGLLSFWKGNLENVLISAPRSAFQFCIYHSILSPMSEQSWMKRILAGSFSGILSRSIIYPLSSLKYHKTEYLDSNGIFSKMKRIYESEGILSFYRGFFSDLPFSIISETIQSSLFAGASKTYRISQSFLERFYLSTTTALVSKFLTFPISTIQRNLLISFNSNSHSDFLNQSQKQLARRNPSKLSQIGSITKKIYKEKKIFGFYDGFLSNIVEDVPRMALNFIILEQVGRMMENRRKLIQIHKKRVEPVETPGPVRTWSWF